MVLEDYYTSSLLSDIAVIGVGIFPTHFSVKNAPFLSKSWHQTGTKRKV